MPKACHLTKYGSAESAVFSFADVPAKTAGPGEVVVKMTMCPVNPADSESYLTRRRLEEPSSLKLLRGRFRLRLSSNLCFCFFV
jgi:NADPH:quinone reductase-like Zn-dependent oxidoreductase